MTDVWRSWGLYSDGKQHNPSDLQRFLRIDSHFFYELKISAVVRRTGSDSDVAKLLSVLIPGIIGQCKHMFVKG